MKRQLSWIKIGVLLFVLQLNVSCTLAQENKQEEKVELQKVAEKEIVLGNNKIEAYLPEIREKRVAIVGNHTSFIGETHLVDSLLKLQINVVKVFSPEHGFRGSADAGEKVKSEIDPKTELPIISLYGKNKKPSAKQLQDVDVILFDIQDVGVRFYTYISTLHYVMEAAAEQGKKIIVLDRPNPNGHYVDGPVLEKSQKSFVGMHSVPVVHGMTIGEYANMINGEGWLKNKVQCDLLVITCDNYTHQRKYDLPRAPSPNLPNMKSIYLYPSLCFFEGTPISLGRGTNKPFQQIGHPTLRSFKYSFTPEPNFGAKYPKLSAQKCFGIDLTSQSKEGLRAYKKLDLSYLLDFYDKYNDKENFFTDFFDLLAGNTSLRLAIIGGKSESEIRDGWKKEITVYRAKRKKYLLYED